MIFLDDLEFRKAEFEGSLDCLCVNPIILLFLNIRIRAESKAGYTSAVVCVNTRVEG